MIDDVDAGTNLAGWYRSLTNTLGPAEPGVPSGSQAGATFAPQEVTKKRVEVRNKNNWFIRRAIESEPSSASSTPPPTLADILARDPPPMDGGYNPPVWLSLGPSNKGFRMLQQSGWNEGEGLGPRVQRRAPLDGDFIYAKGIHERKKVGSERQRISVKKEGREVRRDDGVLEMQNVDVIDITMSDSEEDRESGSDDGSDGPSSQSSGPLNSRFSTPSPNSPVALLTPIPTVLKSDRLGIGLKAKTITNGAYRTSQKRITHGAAALAAHIRAAEDTRKMKAQVGRGHRGFARIAKREQEQRRKMLAYLNE
jgi:hypothetical protein